MLVNIPFRSTEIVCDAEEPGVETSSPTEADAKRSGARRGEVAANGVLWCHVVRCVSCNRIPVVFFVGHEGRIGVEVGLGVDSAHTMMSCARADA